VRNSADHGLEGPEERRAAGKVETGTIKLSAYHEGGHIIIEIADDGRGLNVDRIKAKVLERGLATAAEIAGMSDAQIQQFIMKPGFSTAEKITNVSGRGVGMDVVRSNIEKIGGTLAFTSVFGKGSTFTIKIPLTLAIVSGLIVESGGERFAIPQLAVQEVVRVAPGSEHKIERLKDTAVLRLRNRLLPALSLDALLGLGAGAQEKGYVVVCRGGNHTFGIIVDGIADNEEIVVKPLSQLTKGQAFYSGNTILGDGTVILILDPNGLAATVGEAARQATEDAALAVAARELESILLFRAGPGALQAIRLAEVRRIETFGPDTVEILQGEPVVQYRGRLMPLTGRTDFADRRKPVLVLGTDANAVGLVIDSIVDIVQDELVIAAPSHTPGVRGSAIVAGKAVDVVDDRHFLDAKTANAETPDANINVRTLQLGLAA
jgi:two-component system chemotaxis sensor kinase CheA